MQLFLYGTELCYRDCTTLVTALCRAQVAPPSTAFAQTTKYLTIGASDPERTDVLGGDPLLGVLKHIKIVQDQHVWKYETDQCVHLVMEDQVRALPPIVTTSKIVESSPERAALGKVQSQLLLKGGKWSVDLVELMVMRFVRPDATVLELGGDIGRTSLVIATRLGARSHKYFVTLECNQSTVGLLHSNRDDNSLGFAIEPSALSERRLLEKSRDIRPVPFLGGKEDSKVDEAAFETLVQEGWREVPIVSWPTLQKRFEIRFDTLVTECSHLLWLLHDHSEALAEITTVILKNEHPSVPQRTFVESRLVAAGLRCAPAAESASECLHHVWLRHS